MTSKIVKQKTLMRKNSRLLLTYAQSLTVQKLKKLQDTPPPENKDDLIDYLSERLNIAEEAINESCDCINNERERRKKLAEELKQKNQDLRVLVEGEKKTLEDKVHAEIEKSLKAAIQAKIEIEKERDILRASLDERDCLFEELDYQYSYIRQEVIQVRKQGEENNKKMEENNAEMERVNQENARLIAANEKRDADNLKLSEQLEEALSCLKKLEEVRYTMNRLMGPKGVLEDHERYKLLLQRGDEEEQPEGQPQQVEAGAASKNMLGSNNDYFYNDTRGGKDLAPGGDDDFWYGNDKGSDNQEPLANNEYQAYIANTNQPDTILGKPGSRR